MRLLEMYGKPRKAIWILIKGLKGRLPQGSTRRHRGYGALWAERFKSLLLEGGQAVATVAAYIDLNPVRSSLCSEPKDYRYCGYAETLAKGSRDAHDGMRIILELPQTTGSKALRREDRKHLVLIGASASASKAQGRRTQRTKGVPT